MYGLKKIIGFFTMPLPFCIVVNLVGLFLIARGRRRLGFWFAGASMALLVVLSLPLVGEWLMRPLEPHYPVTSQREILEKNPNLDYVVVLGGGFHPGKEFSFATRLAPDSLRRLIDGLALCRQLPHATLVLSGGGGTGETQAEVMGALAASLGWDPSRLILETQARNTEEQARLLVPVVGTDPFVLVTSAKHMPRALALFRARGLSPVPFPCDHIVKSDSGIASGMVPSIYGLALSNAALHEYLGMLFAWFTGLFRS